MADATTVEVRDCYLQARQGETLIFGPGTHIVGYAIIPNEEYDRLHALDTAHQVERFWQPGPIAVVNNHMEASNVD